MNTLRWAHTDKSFPETIKTTPHKLVVRHAPVLGESLRGYLLRLTEENNYPTSRWLSQLEPMLSRKTCDDQTLEALTRLTGFTSNELRCLKYSLGNTKLAARFMSLNPRVCPVCLEECGYLDAVWDVAFSCCCPYHGSYLIDSCPKCCKPLLWDRPGVTQCNCGADLKRAPIVNAKPQVLMLNARIWAAAGRPINVIGASDPSGVFLSRLNLEQICTVYWFLVANGNDFLPLRDLKPVNVAGAVAALDVVDTILHDWPSRFHPRFDDNCAEGVGHDCKFGEPPVQEKKFSNVGFFLNHRHLGPSPKMEGLGQLTGNIG